MMAILRKGLAYPMLAAGKVNLHLCIERCRPGTQWRRVRWVQASSAEAEECPFEQKSRNRDADKCDEDPFKPEPVVLVRHRLVAGHFQPP